MAKLGNVLLGRYGCGASVLLRCWGGEAGVFIVSSLGFFVPKCLPVASVMVHFGGVGKGFGLWKGGCARDTCEVGCEQVSVHLYNAFVADYWVGKLHFWSALWKCVGNLLLGHRPVCFRF